MSKSHHMPLTPIEIDRIETAMQSWDETGASEFPIRIWQLQALILMARNSSSGFQKPRTTTKARKAPENAKTLY